MKAFVGLCGPLDCGLLAFWGLRHLHSSCFLHQEHNTKGATYAFYYQCRRIKKSVQGFSINRIFLEPHRRTRLWSAG